jgi:hypothetical protein
MATPQEHAPAAIESCWQSRITVHLSQEGSPCLLPEQNLAFRALAVKGNAVARHGLAMPPRGRPGAAEAGGPTRAGERPGRRILLPAKGMPLSTR